MPANHHDPNLPTAAAADFIDPVALMHIKSLELRAKRIVEGLSGGLNRSPYHGFSVEFTEYRQYTPGDDLRYLDWRLYARSDRYYVKRFEDETNLRCHLLVDASRSLDYGSRGYTKADYARTLAATLAYFLSLQRDAVGLLTFDEDVREFIPARYRPGHLRRLLVALEKHAGGRATNLGRPLEELARRLTRRGLLVMVSDLLAPLDDLQMRLGCLCTQGHEVVVFQVLDPAEWNFDFEQPALFRDVESQREIYVDPFSAKRRYQAKLRAHVDAIRGTCEKLGITYRMLLTDVPLEQALGEFLRARKHETARTARAHAKPGWRVV